MTTWLFLASVLLAVLGLFVARTPAAAQEGAACEQYGCAGEGALSSAPPSSSTAAYAAPVSAPASAWPLEEGAPANGEPGPISAGLSSAYGQTEGDPAPEPTAEGNADQEGAEGPFRYWDPPDSPRDPAYSTWPRWDQCQKGSGAVDYHCGLEGLPATWVCAIFYDTVHGTVRGCYVEREALEHGSYCIKELHLYDEAGEPLDTYELCPKADVEYCASDQCAVRRVPDEWWCRTEEWDYGELYGGERRVYTRCADPLVQGYLSGEIPPKPNKICGYLWDERGRLIEATECAPGQGDSQVGYWAGKEAEEADATLNDHNPLAGPSGGSSLSGHGSFDARASPRERAGFVGVVVGALAALLEGRRSSADPQASVASAEVGAYPRGTGAGSEPREAEIGTKSWSTGSFSLRETVSGAAGRGDAAARPGTFEAGGDDPGSSRSGERPIMDASGLWPKIPGAVGEEAARVGRGGIVNGWLEAGAAALAGLGAVGGAFALRRRFLG